MTLELNKLPAMRTSTEEMRRELAHRTTDGIDVSLFWSKPTNRLTLECVDTRAGMGYELVVDGRHALDAFYHPYAYLGASGARSGDADVEEEPR